MTIKNPENSENREEEHELISLLRDFRNCWSDEITAEDIHGGQRDQSPKYKTRKTWWQVVLGSFEVLARDGILKGELRDEAQAFAKEYGNKIHGKNASAEDIACANIMIDKILEAQK